MSHDIENASRAGDAVAAGITGVRFRLAELSTSIGALREEVARLRISADARVAVGERAEPVAVLEEPWVPERPLHASAVGDELPHPSVEPETETGASGALAPFDLADDEAAFERFFSRDVEPEPAQRWLLGEASR